MYDTFLYLQTHKALGLENESFEHLYDYFPLYAMVSELAGQYDRQLIPPVSALMFGEQQATWDDGIVLRFPTYRPFNEIKDEFDRSLEKFKSWAIFQHGAGCKENSPDGLFGALMWASDKPTGTQVFLINTDGSNWASPLESVRASLKCPSGVVARYGNGAIIFASTLEPAKITLQRCARSLQNFDHWVITDSTGITVCSVIDAWFSTYLEDLKFG
jgi:hypothetical protein